MTALDTGIWVVGAGGHDGLLSISDGLGGQLSGGVGGIGRPCGITWPDAGKQLSQRTGSDPSQLLRGVLSRGRGAAPLSEGSFLQDQVSPPPPHG